MLRFAQHDSLLPACVTHLGYTTLVPFQLIHAIRYTYALLPAAALFNG